MAGKKSIGGKAITVIAVLAIEFLCISFIITAHGLFTEFNQEKIGYTNMHFSDISMLGKLCFLDSLDEMSEQCKGAAGALHEYGEEGSVIENYLDGIDYSLTADAYIIYNRDGMAAFGNGEYGELFLDTARKARNNGDCAVSEPTECGDGVMRIGVASPFTASDNGIWAVVLLYPRSSLDKAFGNVSLNNEGCLLLIDSEGELIAGGEPEGLLLSKGWYSVGETDSYDSQVKLITSNIDGKRYYACSEPVGINGWSVEYLIPNKDDLNINKKILMLYIFGGASVILALTVISICLYMNTMRIRELDLFKKKFRIATRQSARAAYEYDRKKDRLVLISESEHVRLPKPYLTLMELGNYVHPADRPVYFQSVADLRSIDTTSVVVRLSQFGMGDNYRWYHVTGTRLADKGDKQAITIGTVEDIDEQETERLVLYERATVDGLTGVWNRAETEKVVSEKLVRLEKNERSVFALMDLDGFKEINDKHGHDCGDKALIYFAKQLKSTFRFGDVLGRLGGDEFMVYMAFMKDRDALERRLLEFMKSLEEKHSCTDSGIPAISCSIGCCIAAKGDDFDSIYKRADTALYESKTRGKMQFTIMD